MPNINASKYGIATGSLSTNFSTARTTANTYSNQPSTSNSTALEYFRDSGKGGTNYRFRRFFLAFDVSAYASGYTITNLQLNWRSTTSTQNITNGAIVVKSTAQGNADTNLSGNDFYNAVDYSTAYSSAFTWTDANSNASVSLNSNAISQFSNSYLKLVMISKLYDYDNSSGVSDVIVRGSANISGTGGFVPYISFDATATGYSNNVIGVDSADINKIINVGSANIENVIGI
tara:strand:+ start:685 stop:1380 length:696 start_codon:yes stop_codon:yes gene_type:complete